MLTKRHIIRSLKLARAYGEHPFGTDHADPRHVGPTRTRAMRAYNATVSDRFKVRVHPRAPKR